MKEYIAFYEKYVNSGTKAYKCETDRTVLPNKKRCVKMDAKPPDPAEKAGGEIFLALL